MAPPGEQWDGRQPATKQPSPDAGSLASVGPGARAAVYDMHLYAFDGLFGFTVVKAVGLAVRSVPGLLMALWLVYQSLVPVVALFVVLQRNEQGFIHGKLLSRFLIAATLGYGIYILLPAMGPYYAAPTYFPTTCRRRQTSYRACSSSTTVRRGTRCRPFTRPGPCWSSLPLGRWGGGYVCSAACSSRRP